MKEISPNFQVWFQRLHFQRGKKGTHALIGMPSSVWISFPPTKRIEGSLWQV